MAHGILIGIDGGGTHSTAVAAYPDGRIAAVAYGGGLNFHNIGVDKAHAHMEEMCAELCQTCGAPAEEILEIVYELDFRDSNTAQLMKVEVSHGSFTVNDRTYPDKKREVMTLIDSLYDE